MAEAAEAQPTHAQMIAEMQKSGFTPPQGDKAPPDPTHDQMIKEMQSAGFAPAPEEGGFLQQHPKIAGYVQGAVNALPAAGAILGGGLGAAAGAAGGTAVLPGVGTLAGATELGMAGTGAGAVVGSAAKDALNSWIFGATKSAGEVTKDAGLEGATAILSQKGGELAVKGLGKVAEKIIPKAVLDKYSQAADAVKALWNNNDGDIAAAADQVKKGITTSLDDYRGQMSKQISETLKDNNARVSGSDIVDTLKDYAKKLDSDLYPGEKQQVEDLIVTVRKKFDENGQIFVSDANELKQFLQQKATAAYRMAGESGGGTEIANAAKQAGAVTRKLVNEAAPEVAAANDKLAALHFIEDRMNKNIIRVGKPESGLIAAGKYSAGSSEGSAANAKALRTLGNITGNDFLGKAQELAAMKTFQGASLTQRGIGAGVGAAAGAGAAGLIGDDPAKGALVGGTLGGAITSPAAVKGAIDIGRALPGALPAVSQTLGQAVMHGSGAQDALRRVGQ